MNRPKGDELAKTERSVRAFGLSIDTLLAFVPAAIFLEHARPDAHTLIFFASCLGWRLGLVARPSTLPIVPARASADFSTPPSATRRN